MGYTKSDISLPMSGLDVDTIFDNLVSAKEEYLDRNRVELKDVAFVDNLFMTPRPTASLPEAMHGVWYLSHSLRKLSACDEAFFYGNWKEARGCQIEHEVCEKYGIPFTEV
jgi:hypothetical protein